MTAQTPAGGWTRKTLAQWGVPWPPPKGWKNNLIRKSEKDDQSKTIRKIRRVKRSRPTEIDWRAYLYTLEMSG